jgi:L-fuconolactonase
MSGVVDAHFHVWRGAVLHQPGVLGELFAEDYGWDEYASAHGGVPVEAAIAVQADTDVSDGEPEVEFLESVAAAHPQLRGIIAAAPIEAADARDKLSALKRHPLVKGVRRTVHHVTDPHVWAQPSFVRGARMLADFGLVCDINAHHFQLAGALAAARQAPDTTIVLNHTGKPDITKDDFPDWRALLDPFADLANVSIKLSLVTPVGTEPDWTTQRLAPYVAHVLERFGPERVIWTSNWPVAGRVIGYEAWYEAAQTFTAHLSESERRGVFHDNAARIYGL